MGTRQGTAGARSRADRCGLPTGALAEEILTPGYGQIRALFNVGGSPMMAWPDQRRTQEALANLDLLVTTDVWYSPTARVADYVAATKMTFETPGMTQVTEGIKYHNIAYGFSEPYAQYTPALLDPPSDSDLIEDWQLFYRVGKRLGLSMSWLSVFGSPLGHMEAPLDPIPLDMDREPTTDELFEIMCRGSNVALAEVKRHPHGHVFEELQRQQVAARDADSDARLDVGNLDLLAELDAISTEDYVTARRQTADRPLLLVPRRENRVINSTGRNIPGLMRGRTYNPAFMHSADLAELDLTPGDTVEIRSAHDAVIGIVEADDDLRRGVVSMSHGFGGNPGEAEDPRADGANTNRLLRTDVDYDPITGMPRHGGGSGVGVGAHCLRLRARARQARRLRRAARVRDSRHRDGMHERGSDPPQRRLRGMEHADLSEHIGAVVVDPLTRQLRVTIERVDPTQRKGDPATGCRQPVPRPLVRSRDRALEHDDVVGDMTMLWFDVEIRHRAHQLTVIGPNAVLTPKVLVPRFVVVRRLRPERLHHCVEVVKVLEFDVPIDLLEVIRPHCFDRHRVPPGRAGAVQQHRTSTERRLCSRFSSRRAR